MRTPRPVTPRRGAATLIGNGWLDSSPSAKVSDHDVTKRPLRDAEADFRVAWPRSLEGRGKSALRECIIFSAPPDAHRHAKHVSPAAIAAPAPRAVVEQTIVSHRRNPAHDVRQMPALSLEEVRRGPRRPERNEHVEREIVAAKKRALHAMDADDMAKASSRLRARVWYEDPIALGALLIVLPPIGLAALWSSKRYSNDARWALTAMTALTLCLIAAVTITVVALRA